MKARVALLLAAFALIPSNAAAQTCTINSVTGLVFGSYDVFFTGATTSTGSVTYECTNVGPSDTIMITLDTGTSGTFATRTLVSGGEQLDYNLYLDAAHTSVWGDGTGGSSSYGPVTPAESTPTAVTIYGRVPALQDAAAGSYSDTVVVTLQF